MDQLKCIYNSPFKDSHSHPTHACFPIIACNVWIVSTELLEKIYDFPKKKPMLKCYRISAIWVGVPESTTLRETSIQHQYLITWMDTLSFNLSKVFNTLHST